MVSSSDLASDFDSDLDKAETCRPDGLADLAPHSAHPVRVRVHDHSVGREAPKTPPSPATAEGVARFKSWHAASREGPPPAADLEIDQPPN
ncbi:hypothetical protein Aph01nite_05190 [Acrocarpospora phusangensis]|uniref:Uncharacterized protein n=1 Tax=Acrocarpospora phusangensis TaxID=1070424 RepID=A0A919Q6N2_9ACTN|nr:hypothetical protein Aph01nite_05190 [Acrocarpospora phusangensis]